MRPVPYRWVLVGSLATIVYSFGVLLGEGAAAGEFSRTLLSASLGSGVVVSGALALLVRTVCNVMEPRRVFLAGSVLRGAGLAAFSQATEGW